VNRCSQPGCDGAVEDGYCNVCGAPPGSGFAGATGSSGASGSASASTPTSAGASGAGSTRTGALGGGGAGAASQRLGSVPVGSARNSRATTPTRRLSGASSRAHARMGAGLTTIASVPVVDPASALMVDPVVAESKRFCPSCQSPVGRSRNGQPGRTEGFCPKCRNPFSFTPKLNPGELVAGQYQVAGCLAHGGLGWIYLAQDHNVSDRYVVLKGLLNSGDADAYQAAITERQFLAEVEHPLIVGIYNFVSHQGASYIVMEYIGGQSLKTVLKLRMEANNGTYDPIPVDQAIAYIIEILPAFSYLHGLGLLYCDFKPDNLIHQGEGLKLIDLGGVRRIDDAQSSIYGTVGYQAPEVPELGPSIAGDVYTIGRTLAVLSFEFRGYQTSFVDSLPPTTDVPVLDQHDSFSRLLSKITAKAPDDRFQSAEEVREQLLGVLREVVALKNATRAAAHSTPSHLFDSPAVADATLTWRELPSVKVDPSDPMAAWLAAVSVPDPLDRLRVLAGAAEPSTEVGLATARAHIEAGQFDDADAVLVQLLDANPWEWRALWYQGLGAMARNDPSSAVATFNAVYGEIPGELAPKLALAAACELLGDAHLDAAEQLYGVCARVDAAYSAPAAFGLARIRQRRNDVAGALGALDLVAPTSRSYVEARRERARLLLHSDGGLPALDEALSSVDGVNIDPRDRQLLVAQTLEAALHHVVTTGAPSGAFTVGGTPCDERSLRSATEAAYRQLALQSENRSERIRLVDAANAVRNRTLW
jgi:serine/threonine-protein kinase PknG